MHISILSILVAASWANPTPPVQHAPMMSSDFAALKEVPSIVTRLNEISPIQLEKLAMNNDQHAQYQLGVNHEFGATGFEKDLSLALAWYERAHQSGNNAAYFAIRRLKIFDPKQSSNAALQAKVTVESLKRLANAGDIPSMVKLARIYIEYEKKYHQSSYIPAATALLEKSAAGGRTESLVELALIAKTNGKKMALLTKAYDSGSAAAPFHLGEHFAKEGTHNQAIYWYDHAYKRGNMEAGMKMASILETEHDYDRAFILYLEMVTSNLKQISGHSAMKLGEFYEKGLGVQQNLNLARYWYMSVIDDSSAMLRVARTLEIDPVDPVLAGKMRQVAMEVREQEIAALKGTGSDAGPVSLVKPALVDPLFEPRDAKRSNLAASPRHQIPIFNTMEETLERAIDNDPHARYHMAKLYENQSPPDQRTAMWWYKKAYESGNTLAKAEYYKRKHSGVVEQDGSVLARDAFDIMITRHSLISTVAFVKLFFGKEGVKGIDMTSPNGFLIEKLADLDNLEAQFAMARHYEKKIKTSDASWHASYKNHMAFWLNRAAKQSILGKARHNLDLRMGEMYQAMGKPQSALVHFENAYAAGDLKAGLRAANVLETDPGLRNYADAFKIYEDLAAKDDKDISSTASFKLAEFYEIGRGVTKELNKARYWYLNVARSDPQFPAALLKVANIYQLNGNHQMAAEVTASANKIIEERAAVPANDEALVVGDGLPIGSDRVSNIFRSSNMPSRPLWGSQASGFHSNEEQQ